MKPIAFDSETTISDTIHGPSGKYQGNRIVTAIYGTNPDKIILSHEISPIGADLSEFLAMIQECTHIIGHNLKFDLWYVWKEPLFQQWLINGGKIWDCQLAEYVLTGQQHKTARLEELEEKHLGQKQKVNEISELYKKGVGADRILNDPQYAYNYNKYCIQDGRSTLLVFKQQYIIAKKKKLLNSVALANDYLLALIQTETTGILLDIPLAESLQKEWNIQSIKCMQQAQEYIKELWNDPYLPEFKPKSPNHRSAVIFGGKVKSETKEKIPVGTFKNGNIKYKTQDRYVSIKGFGVRPDGVPQLKKEGLYYSTDQSIIDKIAEDTDNEKFKSYVKCIQDANRYSKAASTDIKGLLDYQIDGKLHPNFNNTLTKTTRISSSDPNMQNKSKHSTLGKAVHKLFIAPRGWACLQADFGQLEIWVAAWLSGDESLMHDLISGVDMHCKRAGYIHNKDWTEVKALVSQSEEWKELRSAAKEFSYQRAYGAGIAALVERTGLSKEQLQTIVDKEEQDYPKAAKFWKEVERQVKNTAVPSKIIDIATLSRPKHQVCGYELLPIFDKNDDVSYNEEYIRKIGYYKAPTGRIYGFPYTGSTKFGKLRVGPMYTHMKNHPIQGMGSEIQGATSYALLKACLTKPDKIQMINEIHDSKWFYVRQDVLTQCAKYIHDTMSRVDILFKERFGIDLPFKFPVDLEVGPNFGELKNYNIGDNYE